ncbi:MAG: hypothetical protein LBS84_04535 [Clostridiales bacterium]|jgi:hypothetical protein|nr:hypothetical protein [Clostridiales bacterium]
MKEKNLGIGSFEELGNDELLTVSGGAIAIVSSLIAPLIGGVLVIITTILSGAIKTGGNVIGSLFSGFTGGDSN